MKLLLDTDSAAEAEAVAAWGVLAGIRTSRAGLAAAGAADSDAEIVRLCDLLDATVTVLLDGPDAATLTAQGLALADLHEHAVAALPFGPAGLAAASALEEQELAVEVTHVFSAAQALLAAEAGAALVSTSLTRLEQAAIDAGETLQAMVESLHTGETTAQVLAGGIVSPQQVVLAARLGAENAAVPAGVLHRMAEHPLTLAARDDASAR
ncbi:transaldolase family protein [Conexibacter sp. JD483]|uniref:transaldolase family protein n=1 Tax=unclassified Conexibacter TaxID=2627773 RepID=UPI002721BED4|nr:MULTISPECIES: transaldolase family protein [unclassified Conexibacter]MDO8184703.1 transaldolase family protein [Conexibacter sp. CPCC 205706]MDO8198009.1 transaldolase family protein [Conexibacter sp. CPCC 205762]MDR9368439.1 transaldolase family protein [Conexibacter sp. JD483]